MNGPKEKRIQDLWVSDKEICELIIKAKELLWNAQPGGTKTQYKKIVNMKGKIKKAPKK